ncbi:MAG: PH domain-containing protein [Carbonactinosporaceae bacterium]
MAESLPVLPVTWRPRLARMVAYGVAVAVLSTMVIIAVLLPRTGSTAFGVTDRVAFAGVGVLVAGFLHVLARPRLVADEYGLTVVNLFRSRRLTWPEVVNVNLRSGDPWVLLDLDDGGTLAVMAIQSSDGARARRWVAELRALVDEQTRTEHND